MAVTGVFLADFSSFHDAVQKAEVQLRSFESGSNKVESSLSKMTDGFSGRRIIQEATMMAEVFDRAGGASQFTERELARMGATGAEAVAKLKALGIDVPPGIERIASETKKAENDTSSFTGTVKGLAAGFAAMFTARAAFDFVAQTAAEAGALADLSAQTRIGVEELQVMAGAMSGFGVTAEELARALFGLSQRIAGGEDGVADALANMGMKLSDVDDLNGEELFRKIQRGLSSLQGGLRDTTAVELYGSKMGMAMAGAAEGTDAAIDAARSLNTVMSEDTVRALDAADEAIQRASGNLKNMAANMMGPVAEGFNVLFNAIERGASKWDIFVAMARDLGDSWDNAKDSATHLATLLDGLNQETERQAATTKGATAASREHKAALEDQAGAAKFARDETARLVKEIEKLMATEAARRTAEAKKADAEALENLNKLIERHKSNNDAVAKMYQEESAMAMDKMRLDEAAEAARIAQNQREIDGLLVVAAAHREGGSVAKEASDKTIAGYAGIAQQVSMTGEAMKEYINLQRYAASANAILAENGLFTSNSQRQRIAGLPLAPSSSGGGGGSPISINISTMMGDSVEIARQVKAAVVDAARSSGQRLAGAY